MTSGVCRKPALKPISQAFEADRVGFASAAIAALAAAPNPAIPATFSVPARRPSSWPPPRSSGSKSGHSLGQNQRADALRTADLVRRKRHQIGSHRIDIERYFSERLDRIDMQQSAGGMDDLGDLGDRLHRPGFVVGQHHRHQRRRAVVEHRAQTVEIHQAGARDTDDADRLVSEIARPRAPRRARWPKPPTFRPAGPEPRRKPGCQRQRIGLGST